MVIPGLGTGCGVAAAPVSQLPSHARLLELARGYDRRGQLDQAATGYEAAASAAEALGDADALAEALRRLAVVRHRCRQPAAARALGQRSHDLAADAGRTALTAEALNTLGGFSLVEESFDQAKALFQRALAAADPHSELRGRIEQNLGTVESIRGNRAAAMDCYQRSLTAFLLASNEPGCAIAYHNLGVISTERRNWAEADRYFQLTVKAAEHIGDLHLTGLALLNRSEVLVALGRLREARRAAEAAAGVFDELHASTELADSFRMLGVICREAGELGLAQTRLRFAVEVAITSGSALGEAETLRELAIVRALDGHIDEALETLSRAARSLARLKAGFAPGEILRGEYPAFVRAWGELMRSIDSPALAHAERVAAGAVALSRALGHDEPRQASIAVAAYLHDIGRLRLADAARTTFGAASEEAGRTRQYPVWGADLLTGVDAYPDLPVMIRAHQERCDGSGYPDALRGEQVPLEAQIIGIVDHYDAVRGCDTSASRDRAAGASPTDRWRHDVVEAFFAAEVTAASSRRRLG